MKPRVAEKKCVGCGACAAVCPADPCVFEVDGKAKVIHPDACLGCGQCVDACPVEAIELTD